MGNASSVLRASKVSDCMVSAKATVDLEAAQERLLASSKELVALAAHDAGGPVLQRESAVVKTATPCFAQPR